MRSWLVRGREEGVDLAVIALAGRASRPEAQKRVGQFVQPKGSDGA